MKFKTLVPSTRCLATLALSLLMLPAGATAQSLSISAIEGKLGQAKAAMIVDPKKVLRIIAEARAEIGRERSTRDLQLATAHAGWLESEALSRLGELARAEKVAGEAVVSVERLAPNSKLHADILLTQGAIALDQNHVRRAFELFRRAHQLFERLGETRAQAIALQNIGTIYQFAGDQRSVLRYYEEASDLFPGDTGLAQTAANNLGTAYKELGELDRADAQYRQALALARKLDSPVLEVRVLTNLASVSLLRNRLDEAERYADNGLEVARVGDAAQWAPFLLGVKAQIASRRGDLSAATALFERTFAGMNLDETIFLFRDFHESASEAYRRAGDAPLALAHMKAFKRLDDEAREIRTSTNAALAAAQFDYSNQELKISKLRQHQLQQDLELGRVQQRNQWVLLAGSLFLLAGTLVAFFSIRRSRNETRAANADLAQTNGALDQALKAKSEFLATTSHELRTPLNGILGMSQVLMHRTDLEPAAREQIRLLDTAGNTMKAIVDDLLDMAQIENGRIEVDRHDIDLHQLLGDIVALWRPAAEKKDVRIDLDLTGLPPRVAEDERKLRQIVYNLMSNAVKFTGAGRIGLSATLVSDLGEGDRLRIAVSDSGIGIASDQHALVFEPFRQAEGGITRRFGGTGLGLAICTKLAAALGGTIRIDSEPGRGSRFTLDLPYHPATAVREVVADRVPATALDRAHVTVLTPNPLFGSMMSACIEDRVGSIVLADAVDEVASDTDVVVLGAEAAGGDAVDRLRQICPRARLVLVGKAPDVDVAAFELVTDWLMPPIHLAAALSTMYDAAPGQRVAA